MMLRLLVCLSLVLHAGALGAQQATTPEPGSLASLIEKARTDWNVPGLSVAVVKDGHVVLSQGFGFRELNKPDLVDADTLFAIASNTKAFTAAALAILQEEGKVQWEDRVQQHLPWLQLYDPYVSADLRVDDLLCHRSGLGTFSGDLLWWGTPYSPEEVLRRTKHLPAKGPFRAHYGYSNLMFLAAGEVISRTSAQPWSQFVHDRILQPVGMQRTVLSVTALATTENVASPHKPAVDTVTPIAWYNWDTMAAAGGIISSASDMSKWLRVLLDRGRIDDSRRLFSEASSRRMWSPQTVIPFSESQQKRSPTTHFRAYGLGWVLSDYKGRMTVSHGGGYDGMYSHVLLVPEEKLGVVVLTNSMTGIATPLATTLVDAFLGGEQTDWLSTGLTRDREDRAAFYKRISDATTAKVEGSQPGLSPQACAGTYRCPLYGDVTVNLEDGKLVMKLLPNPELIADLTHLHYDTWVIHWRKDFAWFSEGTVQFVPDGQGGCEELKLNVPNDDLWFDELKPRRVP